MNGGAIHTIFCDETEREKEKSRAGKIMTHRSHILHYTEPLDMSFSCIYARGFPRKSRKVHLFSMLNMKCDPYRVMY